MTAAPGGDPPAYASEPWYRGLVAETAACLDDVQRLVLVGNGSSTFPAVRYLLARVEERAAARALLAGLAGRQPEDPLRLSRVSDAVGGPGGSGPGGGNTEWAAEPARLAVGFTAAGLRALGLPPAELATFPAEFRQGPHARSPFLGDTDANDPERWLAAFRTEAMADLHVVVGVWERRGQQGRHDVAGALAAHGLTVLAELRGHVLAGNREPFGFQDGIGQPVVAGLEWCSNTRRVLQAPSPERLVPVGEFVLGRRGELGEVSRWRVPGLARREHDRVGYHGTFAALRVMRQDVDAFERWTAARGGARAAARLCGRTQDGAPLRPEGVGIDDENFDYRDDLDGTFCPLGAHARRAHPRGSRTVSRGMHQRRIIRRGAPYVDQRWDGEDGEPETGLLGLFLCANLATQYEGVLGEWIHHGLHDPRLTGTSDPLIGSRGVDVTGEHGGLPQFVYTRGVAYLFVPGLRGLARLAGSAGSAGSAG